MLSIVATPIGNLQDLSVRQVRTLFRSEIILAEDTRSAQNLLHKIVSEYPFLLEQSDEPITLPHLQSYYKEKEFEKLPEIIQLLKENKHLSLISESGMPLISDPGSLLIKHVIKEQIPFEVVPGPTALTTALLYSGLNTQQFMFVGFLPKQTNDLKKLLTWMNDQSQNKIFKPYPFIAYESPHRIRETLALIDKLYPETEVVVTRELTKMFEEVQRGSAKDLKDREYKGEITILLTFKN